MDVEAGFFGADLESEVEIWFDGTQSRPTIFRSQVQGMDSIISENIPDSKNKQDKAGKSRLLSAWSEVVQLRIAGERIRDFALMSADSPTIRYATTRETVIGSVDVQ